jgi:hypothetical protein
MYRYQLVYSKFIYYKQSKAPFGYSVLKFNSHHINVAANAWNTKCRLIACMST